MEFRSARQMWNRVASSFYTRTTHVLTQCHKAKIAGDGSSAAAPSWINL